MHELYLHASCVSVVASFSNAIVAIPTSASPVWPKSNKHSILSPQTSVKVEFPIKLVTISSRNGGVWFGSEKVTTLSDASYVKMLSLALICPKIIITSNIRTVDSPVLMIIHYHNVIITQLMNEFRSNTKLFNYKMG